MPSRSTPAYRLSDCIRARLHIEITCNWCRTQRVYDPQDLMVLLGNREVDGLRKRIPCEGCGKRDYMEVLGKHLHPEERQGRSLRRLDSVRIIRRPVWRDEPL